MTTKENELQIWQKRVEYLDEFEREMATQSDRGVVLVSLSILDELLAELLKTRLKKDERLLKDLFGTKGVFGTFDDKVKACYAMGLISELNYNLFKKLQNVRNKFAHRVLGISFDDPAIRDVCKDISLPLNAFMPRNIVTDRTREKPKLDLNPIKPETPARERFILAFFFLFIEIENRHLYEQHYRFTKPVEYVTFPILLEKFEEQWVETRAKRQDYLESTKQTLRKFRDYLDANAELLKQDWEEDERKELEASRAELQERIALLEDMIAEFEGDEQEMTERENLVRTVISWMQEEIELAKE